VGSAIGDLLKAEQELRGLAEQNVRDLRAALQLAAYTFAGAPFEAQVRRDQAGVERWTADEWIAFFQGVTPISRGWADPAVLGERLRLISGERDRALAEVHRLQEELALRAELTAGTTAATPATAGIPAPAAAAQTGGATAAGNGRFRWPDVPSKPPARYARLFSAGWLREGTVLGLVASGLSLRLEVAELLGRRFDVKGNSGSLKRVFERLVRAGLLENEVVRIGCLAAMFVWPSDLGREVCRACGFRVQETEYERLLRLHGGEQQKSHAAAVAVFAYHARRRGFRAEVLPTVEGRAEPDVLVAKGDETPVYVEVELGREKQPKWLHLYDLQGFVALCAQNVEGRAALSAEVRALGLHGRATDIETLIQEADRGNLWAEVWE
jgi:hypothetical protein